MALPKKSKDYMPEIEKNMSEGMPFTHACRASGVSDDTVYRWIKKDASIAELIKTAEAKFMKHGLVVIGKAAETHWQAAAWKLERKWPELFGQKLRHEGTVQHNHFHDIEDDSLAQVAGFKPHLEKGLNGRKRINGNA